MDVSLCSWNINGVKNKFETHDAAELFDKSDILIIGESHFKIRVKSPENFYLVGKSKPNPSKKSRGGLAVYRKIKSRINLKLLSEEFEDAVIFEIDGSNVVIAAVYIPPSNSKYFNDQYFRNLRILLDLYANHREIIIIGDLNARMANEFQPKGFVYQNNPDENKNSNGKILKDIISEYDDILLINGLKTGNKYFDYKFTFYRGRLKSQIYVCLSNNVDILNDFKIMDKLFLSDHCPILLKLKVKIIYPYPLLASCANGFLGYDHYDKSKSIKRKIHLRNCDLRNTIADLTVLGNSINYTYEIPPTTETGLNKLCADITEGIYNACKRNKKKIVKDVVLPTNDNCKSENYKAIAIANLNQYERLKEIEPERAEQYKNEGFYYQALTLIKREEEDSISKNRKWNNLYKKDERRLWSQIEWTPKPYTENEKVSANVMHKYFTDIFQSPMLKQQPILQNDEEEIKGYQMFSNVTDANISLEEVNKSIKKIGKGSSFDGICPDIASILPESLIISIWTLFRGIFDNYYPEIWRSQLLIGIPKKEHSLQNPKLRGIAIGPLLSRVFDILINDRFTEWYTPNPQQAGFRKNQGCIIPIFQLFLIIDLSKCLRKTLYIGLFDYEKAFDYLNRSQLVKEMMANEVGSRFIKNI